MGGAALDGRRLLTEEERQKMVSIIHSMFFWVGVLVPDYEVLDDHKIELRETVYRLVTKGHLTDDDKAEIDALIISLKQKEHDLENKLLHDPMTVQAGKALLEEIQGLLKAIDQLRSAESEDAADAGKTEIMSRVEDARRWHRFIQEVKPTN